ncbi:hypothetical protein D5018_08100 [Parashewanella curva]|uniref:Uncharacterized protein n=1 Tax=Parashewanella curva TaxID=2338552 RepID=A0A3L8PXR9_9GAMM|nr:hypothetical protein [Parashewanella curva]RLV60216.1 hypothetical protein D5018_08100 [Parashewanella curva]
MTLTVTPSPSELVISLDYDDKAQDLTRCMLVSAPDAVSQDSPQIISVQFKYTHESKAYTAVIPSQNMQIKAFIEEGKVRLG